VSGKEFGENCKFKMAARVSFFMKKMTILPGGHKVGKCKDIPYG
jgi:hypothetical protein